MSSFFKTSGLLAAIILSASLGVNASEQKSNIFAKVKAKTSSSETSSVSLTPEQQAFAQKQKEQLQTFSANYLNEFAQYKAKYNEEFALYRQRILEKWGEVETSSQDKTVSYSDNVKSVVDFEKNEIVISVLHDENEPPQIEQVTAALKSLRSVSTADTLPAVAVTSSSDKVTAMIAPDKKVEPQETDLPEQVQTPEIETIKEPKIDTPKVDFPPIRKSTEVKTVDLLAAFSDEQSAEEMISDVIQVVTNSLVETYTPEVTEDEIKQEADFIQIQNQVDNQQIEIIAQKQDLNEPEIAEAKQIFALAKSIKKVTGVSNADKVKTNKKLTNKRITKYKIPLKPKSEQARIASVRPQAEVFSAKWNLPLELIVAIVHTESSFNPMAVSHIPAYGLMQIVPHSAGIDVNNFLYKEKKQPTANYLFDPDNNIEAGSVYLHILNSRYLRKITDDESRLYCVIAAYNTGAGNVAKAFSSGKIRRLNTEVLSVINGMSPREVYDTLIKNLPYEETRRYLKKVDDRMAHYKQII